MLQHIGKVVVSLLITNWIYAEAVLLFPPIKPYSERVLQVLRIPTHDEWPGIISSPSARVLRADVDSFLRGSGLRGTFRAIGVLDEKVLQAVGQGRGSTAEKTLVREHPYRSGSEAFDNTSGGYIPGGYEAFS